MTTLEVPPEGAQQPLDAASVIRQVNESNEAVEDQCLRARHAADIARRSGLTADLAAAAAQGARIAHRTLQAEHRRRRASLPRQLLLALATVGADGVACYFAAQALDGSQDTTIVWAILFLAVLAGSEAALDFYRDRHWGAWRAALAVVSTFVLGLGVLRFWYLATIGTGALIPAVAGAALFTAVTAGFLFLGYRALRAAETPQTWRARRWAQTAARAARGTRADAVRDERERDRLIDAYLVEVRRLVLRTCTVDQQQVMEAEVRDHLMGKVAPL